MKVVAISIKIMITIIRKNISKYSKDVKISIYRFFIFKLLQVA